MRYSPWRHARQWWTGWRGRHFRWLCLRYAQAGVAVAWLFLLAALPLVGVYAALIVTTLVVTMQALSDDVTLQRYASQSGAVLIARALSGFRSVSARTWYESNRPSVTGVSATYYVDADALGTGDGSSGNPWNLTQMNANASSGERYYMRGTFNGTVAPVGSGTSSAWLVFQVWPGYECTVTGTGGGGGSHYPAFWLYQAKKEYIWIEGITCNTYTSGSDLKAISNELAQDKGPLVIMDCTLIGGVTILQSTDSWIEGCAARMWGGRALPHGPTTAITVALAGVGAGNVTNGDHKYRVRFKIPYSDSVVTSTTDYSPVGQYYEDIAGDPAFAAYTSTTSAAVTTSAGNGQVDLSDIPVSSHADCTEKEIYRLVVGGSQNTVADWKLLATISNATTTYRDNIADGSLGASLTNRSGNAGTSIYILNSSHRTVVYDNVVTHGGHGGIEIAFTTSSYLGDRSADVRIAFNSVTNEWAGGIATGQSDDAIVEGNLVRRSGRINDSGVRHIGTAHGMPISGIGTIARYNRISETWAQGLVLQSQLTSQSLQAKDCTLVFNVVRDCYGAGFLMYASGDIECSGNTVANNIFWDNCQGGMAEQYETYGYYNGALYELWAYSNNLSGTALTAWYASGNSSIGVNNVIRNNIISTDPGAFVHLRHASYGGTHAINLADLESTYGDAMRDNLYEDPLFVSETYTDATYCQIPAGSPAANAGYAVPGYTYLGSAPDIGVYEVA